MPTSEYSDRSIGSIFAERLKGSLSLILTLLAALALAELFSGGPAVGRALVRNVGLGEVWQLWLAGKPQDDAVLWGHGILFWGRVGKVAQFAGAMVVVFEIIGPDRLRQFGKSLHEGFSLQSINHLLTYARDWHLRWWRVLLFRPGAGAGYSAAGYRDIEDLRRIVSGFLMTPVVLFCLVKSLTTGHFIFWIVILALGSVVGSLLSASVAVALLAGYGLFSLLIGLLLVEPVVWFLERKHLEKLVKIASAIAIAAGFHFDLLAS